MGAGATGYHLPKSNQCRRLAISDSSKGPAYHIDRRAIPPAARESIWQAGDGHELRRIDWPGARDADGEPIARGSILFLPGRGDNYEKYLETLEQWHRAGWQVTAADWRGQAGSGRLGKDPVTGHVDDFALWVEDLGAFWSKWKSERPGPYILAGHSMGGHLVLRTVADGVTDPDALVLSAPMLGFVGPLPAAVGHTAAKLMNKIGDPMRPAWKWSEKPGAIPASRQSLLTHDDDRYQDELWWREHRPELVMGPGSWGWVEQAYASMRGLFAPGRLESVTTPVLLVATSNDKLVSYPATEQAAARLPNAELVGFGEEAHHEILREIDAVRDRAMDAISEFLGRVAPPQ
ncbi:alpha/beta hydrolase [Altererythrobacter arenosus]|uniref:Alpha/beta hydrolase n=1 Tax=Altererythrobacter arenosus TaxID=3032592 RepID=A0ABY8FSQ4_9SPHN|nr:alpha/beta hydrolase [Altererythrobacter sp. CAU 1644]WFL78043.1 alpha/beta hydrolase [Altererythrobacter sp. CAU 1644]